MQGNGLVTDASIIASTGISDPNPFFQEMLSKPYVDQLVAIPHVYGPSVSLAQSGYSGAQLYQMLSNSLGYLNKQGYCYNGKCQKFPVILGETGFDLVPKFMLAAQQPRGRAAAGQFGSRCFARVLSW